MEISTATVGRRQLFTNAGAVTTANVLEVLNGVLDTFGVNRAEIDRLYRYRRGDQPILRRKKTVRPEICNKIVENHADAIVSFKVGYNFGEPVQYVRRGSDESGDTPREIARLNDEMAWANKSAADAEMAEWMYTCGQGYRLVMPGLEDSPLEISSLDPRHTAVIYRNSVRKEPVAAFTMVEKSDNGDVDFFVYTPREMITVQGTRLSADKVVASVTHLLGDIPIIEYPLNNDRKGCFENAIPLLDELNGIVSNRMDGLEQFVQAYMIFSDVTLDNEKLEQFLRKGAIVLPPSYDNMGRSQPKFSIESVEQDYSGLQTMIDDVYQKVLNICKMPDRQGNARASGDSGQAVTLRDGWSEAETDARATEHLFRPADLRFIGIVLRILKIYKERAIDISVRDVDLKFTRNKSDSLLTKAQGLSMLLASGVSPEWAFKTVGLFTDPLQAYQDSLPYLEQARQKRVPDGTPRGLADNNPPDPIPGN